MPMARYQLRKRLVEFKNASRNATSRNSKFGEWEEIQSYDRKEDAIEAFNKETEYAGQRVNLQQTALFYQGRRIKISP